MSRLTLELSEARVRRKGLFSHVDAMHPVSQLLVTATANSISKPEDQTEKFFQEVMFYFYSRACERDRREGLLDMVLFLGYPALITYV